MALRLCRFSRWWSPSCDAGPARPLRVGPLSARAGRSLSATRGGRSMTLATRSPGHAASGDAQRTNAARFSGVMRGPFFVPCGGISCRPRIRQPDHSPSKSCQHSARPCTSAAISTSETRRPAGVVNSCFSSFHVQFKRLRGMRAFHAVQGRPAMHVPCLRSAAATHNCA